MKTIQKLTLAVVAVAAMTACTQNDKPKFDAKEYAERKTERLDKIVELSDAQEKEVYALYLAQGKEIKENIKTLKKECGEMKKPDCKKAEGCKKAECDKAKCEKPCAKKAECNKPCDKKAECKQGHKHHKKHFRHHSLVSPERKKATFEQLGTILTPEQSAKLREHHARRHMCNQNKQCVPCNAQGK